MKKILFYCQYLAGMGHLVRSTEIIRYLVDRFKVCLVIGGEPVPDYKFPVGTQIIYLPALKETSAGELISPDRHLETVKHHRKERLQTIFKQFQPDCLITECFPFGKYKMSFELVPLLELAKSAQVKVVCSLRDLIMTQKMTPRGLARKRARILEQLHQFYDLVLYHGDRKLQTLEDYFSNPPDCEVFYTGYVAKNIQRNESLMQDGKPTIVASVGGGRDGYILLQAILEASPQLRGVIPHHIHVFTGPFMPKVKYESLQKLASKQRNVTLNRFTPSLIDYLSKADLSISLGGYNTTMDVLSTGIRSLILPSPSLEQVDEQKTRAKRLMEIGAIDLLSLDRLSPSCLSQVIVQRLRKPKPIHALNLAGAQQTSWRLQQMLYADMGNT